MSLPAVHRRPNRLPFLAGPETLWTSLCTPRTSGRGSRVFAVAIPTLWASHQPVSRSPPAAGRPVGEGPAETTATSHDAVSAPTTRTLLS